MKGWRKGRGGLSELNNKKNSFIGKLNDNFPPKNTEQSNQTFTESEI